jgi:hypothetical protein
VDSSNIHSSNIHSSNIRLSNIHSSNISFGRLRYADQRDEKYPVIRQIAQRTFRYWNQNGWKGNQKKTPQCVGYAWAHWLEDGPITHKGPAPIIKPRVIYTEAQKVDEWPGNAYAGTSVRAGAKVLKERGFILEYRWANELLDVVNVILTQGPIVVGTNWYENMSYPDKNHLVTATGCYLGGHAYVLNGVSLSKQRFRLKNSWGSTWGNRGSAYISFNDFEMLLRDRGEACIGVEYNGQI